MVSIWKAYVSQQCLNPTPNFFSELLNHIEITKRYKSKRGVSSCRDCAMRRENMCRECDLVCWYAAWTRCVLRSVSDLALFLGRCVLRSVGNLPSSLSWRWCCWRTIRAGHHHHAVHTVGPMLIAHRVWRGRFRNGCGKFV